MEVRNSAAESQSSDPSQPIQESDGDGGLKMVGGPVDVVVAAGVEAELGGGGVGAELVKKKRGRPPRVQAKSPPVKMIKEEDEDVCFICFDGGSLVLCDRRGCPKAYHPACVKRDEAFFQSKAKWNCGWHICSMCEKAAHHMCYTCTYSLCKGCIKKADYVCVRGDKGFCTVCMKTIMLIENKEQGKDGTAQVDFDDKASWEYLFKVYWVYLKGKLSLTLDELTQAKNPWKEATTTPSVIPSTCVHNEVNDLKSITPDNSIRNQEASETKRRKTDDQNINPPHKEILTPESSSVVADWATKELLDFVAHMKNGDTSVLSQFDVQALMLEYIKRNNLRDPRKKSQIICDSRLKNLFGKPRVGHFEMLKLLEFHFFIKEDFPKNTINHIAKQVDPDWNGDNIPTVGKDKKRRNHRKGEERAPQNKLDEYAAIDVHNMSLVYLRRKLMENLIEEREEFHGKVVGSIVRIRISGSDQKHDMYRLVQVVGTSKVDVPYKIGDKSADVVLEVLNLDKKETVSIDTISNQDLSQDECRRLRQSIRCGLVKRFTVGEIEEKAVALQSVRLSDWMEAEILRLNNLRDRASEKGHKKGLREYVEKLQLLKTPEERERRLREIPEVHSDPKMNPDYETDDTEEYFNNEHGEHTKPKYSGVGGKNSNPPKKRSEYLWKNEHSDGSNKVKGRTKTGPSGSRLNQVDCNGSTVTNRNHQTVGSNDDETDKVWHYRDPTGKVQGPFCMVQLQKWSTTGYFPNDMRVWTNREDESLLLNDVLKQQSGNFRLTEKVKRIEGLTICTANPSSTMHVAKSNESTGRFYPSNMASPTPQGNNGDIKRVSSVFDFENAALVDFPSPTPKKPTLEVEKVQAAQDGGAQPAEEWSGYSPTQVKRSDEWHSGGAEVVGGQVAATTSATEPIIHSSSPPVSQPTCNYLPPWQGVRETIEFSTLAEESVSDLLAEVDAMESQNGLPSPTSRRNSFVEDLFNGSFEEFSPTPDHGTRSNALSSSGGDVPPPHQSTTATATTTTATANNSSVFDFMNSENMPFKWPKMQKETIRSPVDINNSTKVEVDEGERETHAVQMGPDHSASKLSHDRPGSTENAQPTTTTPKDPSPESVHQASHSTGSEGRADHRRGGGGVRADNEEHGVEAAAPPLPPPVTIGLDKAYPHTNASWGCNNNGARERSHKVEDSGYNRSSKSWGRQSSFGYSRQRVCKFYESGRCKKGASCNYWHP